MLNPEEVHQLVNSCDYLTDPNCNVSTHTTAGRRRSPEDSNVCRLSFPCRDHVVVLCLLVAIAWLLKFAATISFDRGGSGPIVHDIHIIHVIRGTHYVVRVSSSHTDEAAVTAEPTPSPSPPRQLTEEAVHVMPCSATVTSQTPIPVLVPSSQQQLTEPSHEAPQPSPNLTRHTKHPTPQPTPQSTPRPGPNLTPYYYTTPQPPHEALRQLGVKRPLCPDRCSSRAVDVCGEEDGDSSTCVAEPLTVSPMATVARTPSPESHVQSTNGSISQKTTIGLDMTPTRPLRMPLCPPPKVLTDLLPGLAKSWTVTPVFCYKSRSWMLQFLKNKTLVFSGDSTMRRTFQSVCKLLQGVRAPRELMKDDRTLWEQWAPPPLCTVPEYGIRVAYLTLRWSDDVHNVKKGLQHLEHVHLLYVAQSWWNPGCLGEYLQTRVAVRTLNNSESVNFLDGPHSCCQKCNGCPHSSPGQPVHMDRTAEQMRCVSTFNEAIDVVWKLGLVVPTTLERPDGRQHIGMAEWWAYDYAYLHSTLVSALKNMSTTLVIAGPGLGARVPVTSHNQYFASNPTVLRWSTAPVFQAFRADVGRATDRRVYFVDQSSVQVQPTANASAVYKHSCFGSDNNHGLHMETSAAYSWRIQFIMNALLGASCREQDR